MSPRSMHETIGALAEIIQRIESLDPAVRTETIVALTQVYAHKSTSANRRGIEAVREPPRPAESEAERARGDFFSRFAHPKAADNVLLVAAWLYSQQGRTGITKADIDRVAASVGLTVPARPDNTMRQAKRRHRAMFTHSSQGWKLTAAGEDYVQRTYGVTPSAELQPLARSA